jgi:hypothetical protein
MMRTTYKTKRPEHLERRDKPEDFTNAEYRQVVLQNKVGADGVRVLILEVNQGWWDDANKTPIHARTLLAAPYDSWDDAEKDYGKQIEKLIAEGYIHSFSIDPFDPTGRRYEQLS